MYKLWCIIIDVQAMLLYNIILYLSIEPRHLFNLHDFAHDADFTVFLESTFVSKINANYK